MSPTAIPSLLTVAVFCAAFLCAVVLWQRPAPPRRSDDRPDLHPTIVIVPLLASSAWQLRSAVLLVVVPLVWFVISAMVRRVRRRRGDTRVELAIVVFTEDLAQQLRSGGALASSFLHAMGEHPVVADELRHAVASVNAGVRLELALDALITRDEAVPKAHKERPDSLRLLAASVAVLTASGGPAAPSLERLAETMRGASAAKAEARAQASQAVASATVLAALPVLFAGGYSLIDHEVVGFYFRTTFGGVCLLLMLGLTTMSLVWIEAIVGTTRW